MKYEDIKFSKEEMKIFEEYCYNNYYTELYDTWRIWEYDKVLNTMDYKFYRLNYFIKKFIKEVKKAFKNYINKNLL